MQRSLRVRVSVTVQEAEDGVLIYPNPASSHIRMEWLGGMAEVQLLDARGRVLLRQTAMDALDVDLYDMATGLYFVRIVIEGKREVVRRISLIR